MVVSQLKLLFVHIKAINKLLIKYNVKSIVILVKDGYTV